MPALNIDALDWFEKMEIAMGLFDSVKKIGVQKILDTAAAAINAKYGDIGLIQSVTLDDNVIKIILVLNGLEDVPLEAVCRSIKISEDGSKVELGDFTANKAFLANALNTFATGTFEVPDKFGLRAGLKMARPVFA